MREKIYESKHNQSLNLYFQIHGLSDERDTYFAFKKGKLISIDYDSNLSNNILLLLEDLGYSVNELGTYAYKNLIKKNIELISEGVDEKDIINELNTPYSQLYLDVAYETDIGTQTLHSYISNAFVNRKYNVNKKLSSDIFGDFSGFSYGLQSYLIADYIYNNYLLEEKNHKVKSLKGNN